ncbi:MAG: CHAT domain-containing protein [Flavobacteriales bacterium]|nr:CHAT domain-containing protein [Flavobacteriales bacterium]
MHAQPAADLARARHLEVQGEERFRLSDIGEAHRLWSEALRLRQQAFGDSSAEAAIGYAFQARYHSFMIGPHPEHRSIALCEGQRTVRLLARTQGTVNLQERILAQREYAYAYKLTGPEGIATDSTRLQATRALFADALSLSERGHDTLWMARILHDIGNTYTDQTIRYGSVLPPHRLRSLIDSALHHYQRSTALMTQAGQALSEEVMMDHLTTGLLYHSAYGSDSAAQAIASYDSALRIMLMKAGLPPTVDPLLFEPRVLNKAQMVELLYLRAFSCAEPYAEEHSNDQLRSALRSVQAAVPYWEAMLRAYQSRDLYKVLGSYSHFPFRYGTWLAAELGQRERSGDLLRLALDWHDRGKTGMEQRDRLRAGASLKPRSSEEEQRRTLQNDEACVAFHDFPHPIAFVIDASGSRTQRLPEMDVRVLITALQEAMATDDPHRYQRVAFSLHQGLLAPLLQGKPYRRIVIVPSNTLEGLSFEALVSDTVREATWGALHFLVRDRSFRYARTIGEARSDAHELRSAKTISGIAVAPGTADMPFSRALAERLADREGSPGPLALDRAALHRSLQGDRAVFLVGHAEAPATPDALPYLRLLDGDLPITALDSLPMSAPFVVLSTCSSGAGRTYIGEGTVGIGQVVLRNGVATVVQTLWPVDDRATSEVLARLYGGMDDGLLVSDALTEAKRNYLQGHATDGLANPFYWSGVVLQGRDARLPTRSRPWFWWVGGLLLSGVFGYGLFRRARRSRALGAS